MKLKKKVIFRMIAGFFALATVFNMSMLIKKTSGNVSLDAIAGIAKAEGEGTITVTVTCYDTIGLGMFNTGTVRECNLESECAKVKCSSWTDSGTCTFSN